MLCNNESIVKSHRFSCSRLGPICHPKSGEVTISDEWYYKRYGVTDAFIGRSPYNFPKPSPVFVTILQQSCLRSVQLNRLAPTGCINIAACHPAAASAIRIGLQ